MKVSISIEMPKPDTEIPEVYKKVSVEDKIRQMLDLIDTDHSDHVDWETLRRLYNKLQSIKAPSRRQKNLIDMITPVMEKYGYSDAAGVAIGGDRDDG